MLPNSRKNKGRKLQQHVRDRLLEVFELGGGDVESRSSGSPGVDIMMSSRARDAIGISIECKNTVGTPGRSAMKQSSSNKIPGTIAAVVWKPKGCNYSESMIMFDFGEFINFLKERTRNGSY